MKSGAKRGFWALLALATVVLAGALPAEAGDSNNKSDSGIKLRAVAGVNGWVAAGQAFPVTVTIRADHLIHGTLVVDPGGTGTVALSREVEVAGGNTATFRLLAPADTDGIDMAVPMPKRIDPNAADFGAGFPSSGRAQARLVIDGDTVARANMQTQSDPRTELVGVLPDARAALGPKGSMPNTVPLAVDVGTAHPVALDPDLLGVGALALAPLDQVAAQPDELATLSRKQRAALTRWVEAGGQLLLTGDDPTAAEGTLPAGWLPAAGQGVRAGLGRVRSVRGDWTRQILPSPTRTALEEDILSQSTIQASDSISGRLTDDAGVRLPPGVRLAVMLALYVLVAGPLAFWLVRRTGRRQLAWVAIPALAVTSTGVVVGAGGSLRRGAESAHVTVFETGPGGATATTWSVLSNPRSHSDVGVRLPDGWTASGDSDNWNGEGPDRVRVATTGDGIEATTRPPTGGFGLIRSQGPAPALKGALQVTATSTADDTVKGTVRNTLEVPLHDVAVMVGRAGIAGVGTLKPGQQKRFEVDNASRFELQPDVERGVWPDPVPSGDDMSVRVKMGRGGVVIQQNAVIANAVPDNGKQPAPPPFPKGPIGPGGKMIQIDPDTGRPVGGGHTKDESPVVMAAWARVMQTAGWNYRPPGQAVAVGWTEELPPPVGTIGSGKVARSRSAVVARATVAPAGDRLTDTTAVRSYVRGPATESDGNIAAGGSDIGPGDVIGPDGQPAFADIPAVVAFDVPATVHGRAVQASRLTLAVPATVSSLQVWAGGRWVTLPGTTDRQSHSVTLPAGAVVGGQVFARVHIPEDPSDQGGRDLVLYEKEA